MKKNITITVNGTEHRASVEPRLLLVHFLRDVLGLTGTHVGCETSLCGACTVLLEGRAVKSCTVLAVQANGHKITTVEGLGTNGEMHPVQKALIAEQAAQCGYCMSGISIAAAALLAANKRPTEAEVRAALDKNLCRCGSHNRVVKAVMRAANE